MKCKRILSALLIVACLASLLPAAFAAGGSFSDIGDEETAASADVLRLMGVVSGTGSNQFHPNDTLTRAQFCSMTVYYMGLGDQVALHTGRTIFNDVLSTHWARGQINLAASTTLGGSEDSQRLISGVGNGNFAPDDPITFAQAVTILLRVLGYSDAGVGAAWPTGYLNLAASLKLTQGMNLSAGTHLTRGQAAVLFARALRTEGQEGSAYYSSRGSEVLENVILLATNVQADDNTGGAMRTSHGTYKPENRGVNPTALLGRRGALLLNSKNEIITFVPDTTSPVTVILSANAQAAFLSGGGSRYSISPSTPAFTADSAQDSTYKEVWPNLTSGMQVTLFLEGSQVVGLYYGTGGTAATTGAVIVNDGVSAASFVSLTGGASGYRIQKNRQEIRLSDIQPGDVVTYDAMTNMLTVSDLRLEGVYENAAPNTTNPTQITALGHTFDVLESAWNASDQCKVGDRIVLLLTADGKVAAIKKAGGKFSGNAVGVADGKTVTISLQNGQLLVLENAAELPSMYQGQLVNVSSPEKDVIRVSSASGTRTSGDFDVAAMTVGGRTVSAGAVFYEMLDGGKLAPIALSELDLDRVAAGDIAQMHTNSSGNVDILVLRPVTGNVYAYGRFSLDIENERDENGNLTGRRVETAHLQNSGAHRTIAPQRYRLTGHRTGDFVGVAVNTSGTILSIVPLSTIEGVKASDFFTANENTYVSVGGKTYAVSAQVECYNGDNETFFSGSDPLGQIRAYAQNLTIHVDSIGGKVRVVSAS